MIIIVVDAFTVNSTQLKKKTTNFVKSLVSSIQFSPFALMSFGNYFKILTCPQAVLLSAMCQWL